MSAQTLVFRRTAHGTSAAPAKTAAMRRWGITFAATAISTYALDAVATAAGVLLAASHLLRGVDHALLLGFLTGSYVLWAAGLAGQPRGELEAARGDGNEYQRAVQGRLRPGEAQDIQCPRTAARGRDRLRSHRACQGGAVLRRRAGAALLSDTVTSSDALIFLAGANLGAAAYEYGLARMTRVFLRLKGASTYASFEADWVPKEYLDEYYDEVKPDELQTIAFFVAAMRQVEPGEPVLVFRVGPTLHHVFLAAGKASELHLADYLPANLLELERWIERDADAHDWRAFVRYTLQCEGDAAPTDQRILEREELTRSKITKLLQVDARHPDPLGDGGSYGTVISAYCADSATGDRATWETFMRHIAGMVRPGGVFITAALRRCRWYLVGGKPFPSANVDEDDLRAVLEPGFGCESGSIQARELAEHGSQGYSGIVLGWARRRVEHVAAAV